MLIYSPATTKKDAPPKKVKRPLDFPQFFQYKIPVCAQPVCRPDKVGFDLILGQVGSAAVLLFFKLGIHRTLP